MVMLLKMELLFAVLALASLHSFVLPDAQGDALYELRSSLISSHNQLKDWNPNQVNPCTWSNVNCDANNNVISVTLSNIGFYGTLSPKVGSLKTLQTLCGPQPNSKLLINYGFVDEDNSYDRLMVEAALNTEDPQYQDKRMVAQRNGKLSVQAFQVYVGKEKETVSDMLPYL